MVYSVKISRNRFTPVSSKFLRGRESGAGNGTSVGWVCILVVQGSRLYLSHFSISAVNDQARSGVAALNISDGTNLPWNPVLSLNGSKLLPIGSNSVYLFEGNFTSSNNTAWNTWVAVDNNTGTTVIEY